MPRIVVCGAGPVGLAAAMMLANDGHDVTVIEADPTAPPATAPDAWESWERTGVAQFRQPHNLFARFRQICDDELPGMTGRLLDAGCVWTDYLDTPPPTLTDRTPRPGDDRIPFVTGRRPVVESVFAAAAPRTPGVTVRRGTKVARLLDGAQALPGVAHVTGVETTGGEVISADLVVDATGRRSPANHWLAELGARPVDEQAEDRGFVYYTRYFTGSDRPRRLGRALTPHGSISLLTLDGDNDTWSVTVYGLAGDAPLRELRHPDRFAAVVSACPLQAHWLDGKPITGVLAMAGILDRLRRFVVDGRPVATGFAALGDAWACTNPSAGRGLSMGLIHAQQLRYVVREHLDAPAEFALAWHEATEREVAPFYHSQVAADRFRVVEMAALRDGATPPQRSSPMDRLAIAAAYDADAFRALLEVATCLALPAQVLDRPAVAAAMENHGDAEGPRVPGPDRDTLLKLLAA